MNLTSFFAFDNQRHGENHLFGAKDSILDDPPSCEQLRTGATTNADLVGVPKPRTERAIRAVTERRDYLEKRRDGLPRETGNRSVSAVVKYWRGP